MEPVRQLDRRMWLVRMSSGAVAVWSQVAFGLGKTGWRVALGGSALAAKFAAAQDQSPVEVLRVATSYVNSYVLVRGKEAVIVDTGIPNSGAKFAEVVSKAGLGASNVRHLILTHKHPDHVGSLDEVSSWATSATVYAGAADVPNISSKQTIRPVGDGDQVAGLHIIATPGHTPGHICVHDPVSSLMVVGDAANHHNHQLSGPTPMYTADMAEANKSLKKLSRLRFEKAYFGHGEPITASASKIFTEFSAML
jgi:glyoxylase-like metal-dependent hydrolase (beta-lactamase superfamily II)